MDLFVCSSREQLKNIKCRGDGDYVIVTPKYAFYSEQRKVEERIIYMEPDGRTDYGVIKEILNSISDIISACDTEKKYLYRVSYHHEGVGLPATIDCLLQNIKLLKEIINRYQVKKLYLVDDKVNWMLNEAAFLWVYLQEIDYVILDEKAENETQCLFTLRRSAYHSDVGSSQFDAQEHAGQLERYLRRESKRKETEIIKKEIGFLYGAQNNNKHFSWQIEDAKLYQDFFDIGVICLYESGDIERLRREGIHVECLEEYFDKELFLRNYEAYVQDCMRITEKLNKELKVIVNAVDISEYLRRKTVNYLERECLKKLYLDTCAYVFFKRGNYRLIEAWGTTNFWQSNIIYANCRQWGTKLFRRDILEVFYTEEYEPYADEIALRIWYGKRLHRYYDLGQYNGVIRYVPELGWKDFTGRPEKTSVKLLCRQVNIFFAPTYPAIGYSTVKDYWDMCTHVLEELPSEQCRVLIKNHPNLDKALEREMEQKYKQRKHIVYADPNDSIKSYLENCDIVITDASTVIFDAIKQHKPVFCIVGELGYQQICMHEEQIAIYKNPETLCDYLKLLLADREKMQKELSNMIDKQDNYMKSLLPQDWNEGHRILCDVVKQELLT